MVIDTYCIKIEIQSISKLLAHEPNLSKTSAVPPSDELAGQFTVHVKLNNFGVYSLGFGDREKQAIPGVQVHWCSFICVR